ncbi:hypothetical protein MGWOODY_XGa302 [hydrothermal vent metagenome]|uniref:Uncharacterized protein n=1 Tax=hydrothermal vent metagenome TaxID=652676 RepID=A0A160TYP7_9ZZZZ
MTPRNTVASRISINGDLNSVMSYTCEIRPSPELLSLA